MNRNDRLAADYREMLCIQNRPYLSWIATKGELPCAEEYLLTVRLRSYALSVIDGSYTVGAVGTWVIRVTLWDSYPYTAPCVRMLSLPPVFHPAWYSKGTYCSPAPWYPEDSLKDYVLMMLGTLLYDPALTQSDTPANYKALDWYLRNRDNTALFPPDTIALTENTPEQVSMLEKAPPFDEIVDAGGVR